MPEWNEHGLFGKTDQDDPEGASIGMCKQCQKMGIGMQLKDDTCRQCRYANYKREGGKLPDRAWRG